MGRLTVDGLDTLREDLAALAALPDSVIDSILDAEADVIAKAQREETARQWQGDYATGTTSRSIKKGKARKSGDGRAVTVAPQGTNARARAMPRSRLLTSTATGAVCPPCNP